MNAQQINNHLSTSSYELDSLIFNFYKVSPIYSVLITFCFIYIVGLFFVKMFNPKSLRLKILGIQFNQLTLSGIFLLSSVIGYFVQVFSRFRFSIPVFLFTFVVLLFFFRIKEYVEEN